MRKDETDQPLARIYVGQHVRVKGVPGLFQVTTEPVSVRRQSYKDWAVYVAEVDGLHGGWFRIRDLRPANTERKGDR